MSRTFHRPAVSPEMPEWLAERILREKRRARGKARRHRHTLTQRRTTNWRTRSE